jgi:hypothetical protein
MIRISGICSLPEGRLDDLEWLRWPGGFAGRYCGHPGGRLADGRI